MEDDRLSIILNIGSALLFVVGIISVFFGLFSIFLPSSVMLSNEDLLGMTVVEIQNFNPKVVEYMERYHQLYGVYLLSFALFLSVISLIPYRKGEKWAWYATLVIGGLALLGTLILSKKMVAITLNMILIILWIAGLALPAKEILGKPSS
jgi:hypothetical protein